MLGLLLLCKVEKNVGKNVTCVFLRLPSRTVYLELSYELDTNSFLNSFYGMVNRRRLKIGVLSDNGTNFVGAVRELREFVSKLDREKINDSVCNRGIIWHFNLPHHILVEFMRL